MGESRVVTAVGISVNVHNRKAVADRIAKAMSDAILECNQEGISTEDKNSGVISARMMAARERILAEVRAADEASST